MTVPIYQVDAFTSKPFGGNPAAVCLLSAPRPDAWMQSVALEMNLSETAFLLRENGRFRLRWFTPAMEVDLCGHATLATAHLVWSEGLLPPEEPARFLTRSGELCATRLGNLIELDFPQWPVEPVDDVPPTLARAIGAEPRFVCRSHDDLCVVVESEDVVRGLEPDLPAVAKLAGRVVSVTAVATDPEFDFVSRSFGPAAGIAEDPVCGSAHCCLGPLWRDRLRKETLRAYQASPRGGVLEIRFDGDRIRLGGHAVTTLRGELLD